MNETESRSSPKNHNQDILINLSPKEKKKEKKKKEKGDPMTGSYFLTPAALLAAR